MLEYPIIRRVRRKLIVQDTRPVSAGSGEPMPVEARTTDHGPQTTGPAKAGTPSNQDAAITSQPGE